MKTKQKYKIHITPEDIIKGTPNSVYSCPIARAVKRTIKKKVAVYGDSLMLGTECIGLPAKCEEFVDKFDSGSDEDRLRMRPFCFVLKVPTYD